MKLSYQPLARKYRPVKFKDLVGQESLTKALSGAIAMGRLHPCMILSGVRGIGKTTTARLLAKALNCEKGPSAEPCGVCESCVAISKSNHEDVLEIDGASNNGVDEVRALKETVNYVPQRSKYKIYIIDEVHMLSTSAFNALLKTIEEPPPEVIFIFATTELQKIPATVVGRCLTFHLNKLTIRTMKERVRFILDSENIPYEEDALSVIAREGRGSMRDALTFLDQVIAIGEGQVTVEALSDIVNSASSSVRINILKAMVLRDADTAIDAIENLDEQGVSFSSAVEELAKFARHGFILNSLGKDSLDASLLGLTEDEKASLIDLASSADELDLNRIFRTLIRCLKELDGSDLDRYVFENYVLEWCFDPGLPNIDELLKQGLPGGGESVSNLSSSIQASKMQKKEKPKVSLTEKFFAEVKEEVDNAKHQVADLKKDVTSLDTEKSIEVKAEDSAEEEADKHDAKIFPETWKDLVEGWKKFKPLQARKLEDVHPVEYSSQKIVLAVDAASMVASSLLDEAGRRSFYDVIHDLFAFNGELKVVDKLDVEITNVEEPNKAPVQSQSAPTEQVLPIEELPETILQSRSRENEAKRKDVIEKAKTHELTQSLIEKYDGEIVGVKITDPSLES